MKMEAQHTKAFILWCLVKAVLRGKIIVINTYITKKKQNKTQSTFVLQGTRKRISSKSEGINKDQSRNK